MTTTEKIALLKPLSENPAPDLSYFYDILEECGDLKYNYYDYATTNTNLTFSLVDDGYTIYEGTKTVFLFKSGDRFYTGIGSGCANTSHLANGTQTNEIYFSNLNLKWTLAEDEVNMEEVENYIDYNGRNLHEINNLVLDSVIRAHNIHTTLVFCYIVSGIILTLGSQKKIDSRVSKKMFIFVPTKILTRVSNYYGSSKVYRRQH